MKPKVKLYRRGDDPEVYEAIQYTVENDISTVAKFVLNMDVDKRLSVANERILDVVRPIFNHWSPTAGVATIEIVNPWDNTVLKVWLNDWVVRNGTNLQVVRPAIFWQDYEEIKPEKERTEVDELADFIYDILLPLEGELYQALAENIAAKVIKAGWSKRG